MTTPDSLAAQPSKNRLPRRSLTVAAFVVAGLTLSADLPAQTVNPSPVAQEGSAVYAIAKVRVETKQVNQEIGEAVAKDKRLAAEQAKAEGKRDELDHDARRFNDSSESQRLRTDIADYQGTCAGKMLYGSEVSRCENRLASINGRLERNNKAMTSFQEQFNTQEALVQRLKNDQVLANAQVTKLRNYLSWLTAAEGKLSAVIGDSCKGVPEHATVEELKHRCGNISFDAARDVLPPCDTERCKAWVMYAKPQRTAEQAIQDYKSGGTQGGTPNPLLDKRPAPPAPPHDQN